MMQMQMLFKTENLVNVLFLQVCWSLVVWKEEGSEVVSYKTITLAATYDPVKK